MAHASVFRYQPFRRIISANALIIVLLILLLFPGRAAATLPTLVPLYAKPGGPSSGNCEDWAHACELRYAISLATGAPSFGYDIYAEEGTYKPTSGISQYESFNFFYDDVSLYGGYASTDHSRDPAAHPSILSGDLAGNDAFCTYLYNNSDNSRRVVYVSDIADGILLDGFTITGGFNAADDIAGITSGAGLWAGSASNLRLKDVVFYCNHAEDFGGGMFDSNGATLLNVTFNQNTSTNHAGAYYVYGSNSLTNVTFAGNSAYDGGAMYIGGGSPTLTNATFHDNNPSTGTGNGAAIFVASGASPVLKNVILWQQSGYLPLYNAPGATSSIDHSVVKYGCPSGSTCTNLVTTNPQLLALGSYGGFTPTVSLGTTSSAIDTGDDAACAAAPVNGLDQRGIPRPQGPHCDVGAFEWQHCYVDDTASGANNGTSWTDAWTDLQPALVRWLCTEAYVAEGTYLPDGADPGNRGLSFNIPPGLAVYGGYPDAGGTRDWVTNVSTLSGDIGTGGVVTDNSYHVVWMDGSAGSTITGSTMLDGFTISGGRADGTTPHNGGGGMYCDGGNDPGDECSPTLAHLTFSANWAQAGGGLYNRGEGGISSPILDQVTFSDNSAGFGGGALANAGSGGGVYSPQLTNVTFSGNQAVFLGGAILNGATDSATVSPKLANVTFYNNHSGYRGGAIVNLAASSGTANSSFKNVTFSINSADFQGGAIFTSLQDVGSVSNPTLSNVILWGDTAADALSGPEIYVQAGAPSIDHSVVEGGCGSIAGASCGSGNLSTDPMLDVLADNGGLTETMALLAGSSAIDTGDDATCAATPVNGVDQTGAARPQGPFCDIGSFEMPQTSVTFRSVGTQDGWILESTETSGRGGSLNSTDTQFNLGDDALNRQYRAILSFNTGPTLPDTAVITSATLKLKKTGLVGADPFSSLGSLAMDVRQGGFSGNAALQLTDFYAAGTKNYVGSIGSVPVGVWYSGIVNPSYLIYLSLTSGNQFRLRFSLDDNNNSVANYLRFASGNAITTSRPQLIITYYVP